MKNRFLVSLLVAVLALRFASLGVPGLIDSTEGRYASIAQQMVITHDWIVPQIPMPEGLVPYWGKPPLHFWIAAGILDVVGMNEFAARLPSFLMLVAIVGLVCWFARAADNFGNSNAIGAALILCSSGLVFYLSGGAHLDLTLLACLTGALVTFFLAVQSGSRRCAFAFFAFLSGGMLTKGPLTLVLCGPIIVLWALLQKNERAKILKLPWAWGLGIFLALSVPWFIIAEKHSPGLLRYFFVQENFLRYLDSSYGDKYGSGHTATRGASWVMLAMGFIPWTFVLVAALLTKWQRAKSLFAERAPWFTFLVLWALMPVTFFTFARQILPAYMLPCYPPLALITAKLLEDDGSVEDVWIKRVLSGLTFLFVAAAILVVPVGVYYGAALPETVLTGVLAAGLLGVVLRSNANTGTASHRAALLSLAATFFFGLLVLQANNAATERRSTKLLFEHLRGNHRSEPIKVAVLFGHPFSAYFYGNSDPEHVIPVFPKTVDDVLASEATHVLVKTGDLDQLSQTLKTALHEEERIGKWIIFKRT